MALMCVKNHPAKEYFGQQRERERGFGLETCKAMKSCRWLSVEVQEAVENYVFIHNKRRWELAREPTNLFPNSCCWIGYGDSA